jgi:hypothetical protein
MRVPNDCPRCVERVGMLGYVGIGRRRESYDFSGTKMTVSAQSRRGGPWAIFRAMGNVWEILAYDAKKWLHFDVP